MKLRGHPFRLPVFLASTLAAAAILAAIVVVPQWLSRQARLDVMRSHVGQVARLAASVVDGDLHRQLLEPAGHSDELYRQALAPLVRFHSANPEMFYVYTMIDRGDTSYFILDTATSEELVTRQELKPSAYMERFDLRPEYQSDWLQRIAAGETWVTPTFQVDDYGTFLSAHSPIYDGKGRYSGFVGVDYSLQYYLAQEARFRAIGLWSLAAAMLAALIVGYFAARYHFTLHEKVDAHYRSSMRDELTGLLNRRGAREAIAKAIARREPSYAAMLVDIDDLKRINDTHGHAAGDAVIASVARVIQEVIGEGAVCARLGGDEFIIFAPDCDATRAQALALRIVSAVSSETNEMRHASATISIGIPVGISVGISVQSHAAADFEYMYRQADTALYDAKSQGKRRVGI